MTQAINRVAICCAGAMGSGIAQTAAQAGALVTPFDVNEHALASSEQRIGAALEALSARGKLTNRQVADIGRKTGRGVYVYPQPSAPTDEGSADLPVPTGPQAAAAARLQAEPGSSVICESVHVAVARGVTARAESRRLGMPVALLDWTSPQHTGPVGAAVSHEAARPVAAGILAASGRALQPVADRPGLIVTRTLAQIANSAADAVLEQVASEPGVDEALRHDANYSFGPFAWADGFGRAALIDLLDAIADGNGEAIYRPSHYLRITA